MSELRVSFPAIEVPEGRASLDARSFRQAAVALASGTLPRQAPDAVYVVAPEKQSWLVGIVISAIAAAIVAAFFVWLL